MDYFFVLACLTVFLATAPVAVAALSIATGPAVASHAAAFTAIERRHWSVVLAIGSAAFALASLCALIFSAHLLLS